MSCQQPGSYLAALARNRSLPAEVVSELVRWLVDDWYAIFYGREAIAPLPWSILTILLRQHPGTVKDETIRKIYELPRLVQQLGVTFAMPRDPVPIPDDRGPENALLGLVAFSWRIAQNQLTVPSDVLCAAIPFVCRDRNTLLQLLRHPNANTTVYRQAFYASNATPVREFLASQPGCRQDPDIRKKLLRSKNPKILAALVEDADPQTAANLVRRLIQRGRLILVAWALSNRSPDLPLALDATDLAPLLRSHVHEVRLAGVSWLGRLTAARDSLESDARFTAKTKGPRLARTR